MEGNTSKTGAQVPSLLANVEVSNLPDFDFTTPATSPKNKPATVRVSNLHISVPWTMTEVNGGRSLHDHVHLKVQVEPMDRVTRRSEVPAIPPFDSPFQARPMHPVSISLPASPTFGEAIPAPGLDSQDKQATADGDAARQPEGDPPKGNNVRFVKPDKVMFRSQPMPGGVPSHAETMRRMNSRVGNGSRDKRYDTFKTFTGKLERQLTHLTGVGGGGGVPNTPEEDEESGRGDAIGNSRPTASMPKVDRFFAALEGPELDQLKVNSLNFYLISLTHSCQLYVSLASISLVRKLIYAVV